MRVQQSEIVQNVDPPHSDPWFAECNANHQIKMEIDPEIIDPSLPLSRQINYQ